MKNNATCTIIGVYTFGKEHNAYVVMDKTSGKRYRVELARAIELAKAGCIDNAMAVLNSDKPHLRGKGCSLDDLPKKEEFNRPETIRAKASDANENVDNNAKNSSSSGKYIAMHRAVNINSGETLGFEVAEVSTSRRKLISKANINQLVNSGVIVNGDPNALYVLPKIFITSSGEVVGIDSLLKLYTQNIKLSKQKDELRKQNKDLSDEIAKLQSENSTLRESTEKAVISTHSGSDNIMDSTVDTFYSLFYTGVIASTTKDSSNAGAYKINPDVSDAYYCYDGSLEKIVELNKDCSKVRATHIPMIGRFDSSSVVNRIVRVSDIRITPSYDLDGSFMEIFKDEMRYRPQEIDLVLTMKGRVYAVGSLGETEKKNYNHGVILGSGKSEFIVGVSLFDNGNNYDVRIGIDIDGSGVPQYSEEISLSDISGNPTTKLAILMNRICEHVANYTAAEQMEFKSGDKLVDTLSKYYNLSKSDVQAKLASCQNF